LELNISPERLKSAPGFDKKNWPEIADPTWSSEIDRHYQDDVRSTTASTGKPVK